MSPHDKACFVAVKDIKTEEVITILPLDYHTNLAWNVSIDAVTKAWTFQSQIQTMLVELYPKTSDVNPAEPSTFKVTAVCNLQNGRTKLVNLGSVPADPYQQRIEKLLDDEYLTDMLAQRVSAKGIKMDDITGIYVRLGTKGRVVSISSW